MLSSQGGLYTESTAAREVVHHPLGRFKKGGQSLLQRVQQSCFPMGTGIAVHFSDYSSAGNRAGSSPTNAAARAGINEDALGRSSLNVHVLVEHSVANHEGGHCLNITFTLAGVPLQEL